MSAFELVCRLVLPHKGRHAGRRRAIAPAATAVTPPGVLPAGVAPITRPHPYPSQETR